MGSSDGAEQQAPVSPKRRASGAGGNVRKPDPATMKPKAQPSTRDRYDGQFFKTKVCCFWQRGQCTRGKECKYAHGAREIRNAPDLTNTSWCPAMLKTGQCDRKDDCPFAHSADELRATDRFFKTTMCAVFASKGECWLGDQCRHAHSENELRKVPPKLEAPHGQLGARTSRQALRRKQRLPSGDLPPTPGYPGALFNDQPKRFFAQDRGGDSDVDSSDLEDEFGQQPQFEWSRMSTSPAVLNGQVEPLHKMQQHMRTMGHTLQCLPDLRTLPGICDTDDEFKTDDEIEDMDMGWGRTVTAPTRMVNSGGFDMPCGASNASSSTAPFPPLFVDQRVNGCLPSHAVEGLNLCGYTGGCPQKDLMFPCNPWQRQVSCPVPAVAGGPVMMAMPVPVMVVPMQRPVVQGNMVKEQGNAAQLCPQPSPMPSIIPDPCKELTARLLESAMPDCYED